MKEPLVTVILPCYNGEKYIRLAIESILNQTYKNLEILVINDGSTDNSMSIIESYCAEDNRIILISNHINLGLIKTLNLGIDLAKGHYISRMDADDISHHSRIQKQVSYLIENPEIDLIGCRAISIGTDGQILSKKESQLYLEKTTIKISSLLTQALFHGSILGKASVFINNKYSEEYKHSEDFELWNRIQSQGFAIENLNESLYYYRINPIGVSATNTSWQNQSHNEASKKYLEIHLKKEVPMELVRIINNRPIENISFMEYKDSKLLFKSIFSSVKMTQELANYKKYQSMDISIQALRIVKSPLLKIFVFFDLALKICSKKGLLILTKKITN